MSSPQDIELGDVGGKSLDEVGSKSVDGAEELKEEYVPVAGMMFDSCGGPKFEMFGHQWHVTEFIAGLLLAAAGCTAFVCWAGMAVSGLVISCMFMSTSGVSLVLLWDYHTVDTLAKLAGRYKLAAKTNAANVEQLEKQVAELEGANDKIAEDNHAIKSSIEGLHKRAGLGGKAANELHEIQNGLGGVLLVNEMMNEAQKKLNLDSARFLKQQKAYALYKKACQIKSRVRGIFEDYDNNRDGDLKGGELRRVMKRFERVFDEEKVPLDMDKIDKDGSGSIGKWELFSALDGLLEKWYSVDNAALNKEENEKKQAK